MDECNLEAPCTSGICQNGGTCREFDNDIIPYYDCECINGYTGYNCEICKKIIHVNAKINFSKIKLKTKNKKLLALDLVRVKIVAHVQILQMVQIIGVVIARAPMVLMGRIVNCVSFT